MRRLVLILLILTLFGCEKKGQTETQIGAFVLTEYYSTNMLFGPGPRGVGMKICAERLDLCLERQFIGIGAPDEKYNSPIIELCDSDGFTRFFNKQIPFEIKCQGCNAEVLDCSAESRSEDFWLNDEQLIITTDIVTKTPIYNLLKFSDREVKNTATRFGAEFFYKPMPFQYLSYRPTAPGIAWYHCVGTDCEFRWIDLVSGASHFEKVPCRVGDKLKIVWGEKHAELFTERDAKHYEICLNSDGKMLFPFEPEAQINKSEDEDTSTSTNAK